MPVSPLMDRTQPGVSSSQAGFLTIVVLPLLHAWTTLLPAAGPLLYAAMSNRAQWEGEAIATKAHAKSEALAAEAVAIASAKASVSAVPAPSGVVAVGDDDKGRVLPRARAAQ